MDSGELDRRSREQRTKSRIECRMAYVLVEIGERRLPEPTEVDKTFADALNTVAVASIITFAEMIGTFYKALVATGMPKEYASMATIELLKSKIFGGTPNASTGTS